MKIVEKNRKILFNSLLLLASIFTIVLSGKVHKGGPSMKILTNLDKKNVIVDNVNEIPIIPLGFDIFLIAPCVFYRSCLRLYT